MRRAFLFYIKPARVMASVYAWTLLGVFLLVVLVACLFKVYQLMRQQNRNEWHSFDDVRMTEQKTWDEEDPYDDLDDL